MQRQNNQAMTMFQTPVPNSTVFYSFSRRHYINLSVIFPVTRYATVLLSVSVIGLTSLLDLDAWGVGAVQIVRCMQAACGCRANSRRITARFHIRDVSAANWPSPPWWISASVVFRGNWLCITMCTFTLILIICLPARPTSNYVDHWMGQLNMQ
jgi:hypothetical protein